MVTVADLIKEQASRCQCQCELVVSGTMSARDALDRMNDASVDCVGIDIQGDMETGLKLATVLAAFFQKWPYRPGAEYGR